MIPVGAYLDGSHTCIVFRSRFDCQVSFIPLESLRTQEQDEDAFLRKWTRWLPEYPLTRAADRYLAAARARPGFILDSETRTTLLTLAGLDVLA